MQENKAKLFRWLFVVCYALLYAGFFFHKSVRPVLLGYSLDHLVLLVLMAVPFCVPWVLARFRARLGHRKFTLLLMVFGFFLLFGYAIVSLVYYNRQRYKPPFEPYLQARPLPLDESKLQTLLAQRDQPDRPLLIVILGGSTSVHYPTLLLEKLRKQHPTQQFEILNLAQNSYSIKHSLIRYGTHFDQWKPDIVIGLFGLNELVRNFSAETMAVGPYDDEWSHFSGFTINAVRPPTLESLVWDRLQYSWYRTLRVRAVDMSLDQFKSIRPYEQHLHRLAQWIKQNGATGLFVTQPTLYKPDNTEEEKNSLSIQISQCLTRHSFWNQEYPSSGSLAVAMKAYNQTLSRAANEEGMQLLDLDSAIPKNQEYFTDDCHWTTRGTVQVADLIAEALAKKGMLKRRTLDKPPP